MITSILFGLQILDQLIGNVGDLIEAERFRKRISGLRSKINQHKISSNKALVEYQNILNGFEMVKPYMTGFAQDKLRSATEAIATKYKAEMKKNDELTQADSELYNQQPLQTGSIIGRLANKRLGSEQESRIEAIEKKISSLTGGNNNATKK